MCVLWWVLINWSSIYTELTALYMWSGVWSGDLHWKEGACHNGTECHTETRHHDLTLTFNSNTQNTKIVKRPNMFCSKCYWFTVSFAPWEAQYAVSGWDDWCDQGLVISCSTAHIISHITSPYTSRWPFKEMLYCYICNIRCWPYRSLPLSGNMILLDRVISTSDPYTSCHIAGSVFKEMLTFFFFRVWAILLLPGMTYPSLQGLSARVSCY